MNYRLVDTLICSLLKHMCNRSRYKSLEQWHDLKKENASLQTAAFSCCRITADPEDTLCTRSKDIGDIIMDMTYLIIL